MSPMPTPEPHPARTDVSAPRTALREQIDAALKDGRVPPPETDETHAPAIVHRQIFDAARSVIPYAEVAAAVTDAVWEPVAAALTEYRDEAREQRHRAEQAEDRLRAAASAYSRLDSYANAAEAARDRWRNRAEQAEAAVQRVRRLHARDDSSPHGPWCGTCLAPWPCRTLAALDPPAKETR